MSIHDWTRVPAGIFHAFHHSWIEEISRALNRGILPPDYYALPEQFAAGFGPDVLTLQEVQEEDDPASSPPHTGDVSSNGGVALAAPRLKPTAETDMEFYRRKQRGAAVRHVSDDRIVAVVEIVSTGNKSSRNGIQAFLQETADLLSQQIHLLIIDLFPPGPRDTNGIHGEIWDYIAGQDYDAPSDEPLTLASYEAALGIRAFVVHAAVGDELPEMPLFLERDQAVHIPLEKTYRSAFDEIPRRWRRVLESPEN